MAELTQEQYEQVPEFLKGDFEQVGEVFRLKAEGKVTALKQSMNDLNGKLKGMETSLNEIQEQKAAEIEAAKAEALEKARSKGDVAAIEKRYQEQMEDLQKRSGETIKQYEDRLAKLTDGIKASKKGELIADIAAKLNIFEKSRGAFSKLIGDRIDIDPDTGKATFFDVQGGALSIDSAGFLAELEKDEGLHPLRQAPATKGGFANGNNSGGGASTVNGSFGGSRDERKAAIAKKFNLSE